MLDPTMLFLNILFSSIGFGYYLYGKRQQKLVALLSGVGLFIVPYGIESTIQLLIVGLTLAVLPFFMRW